MPADPDGPRPAPSQDEIASALERLSAWSGLAGSKRLRGVLAYICDEVLEGRGPAIRAKTIGLDHYGYSADELIDRESVVRVDVGRLRRRLEEYYHGPGTDAPVRIVLPKGSYTPEFTYAENTPDHGPPAAPPLPRRVSLAVSGLAVLAVAGVLFVTLQGNGNAVPPHTDRDAAERTAVFDVSPVRLQAMDLAETGRDLIFPATEPARVRVALATFEAAIETDPTYFGGHAGAAQVLAILSLLAPDPQAANGTLDAARAAAAHALELAPGDAWSQSAKAWLAFVEAEYDDALALSARAVSLAPDNPHLVEFDSLISLFAGEFGRVVAETERILTTLDRDTGFVFTNALGSARYHQGDDAGAIAAMEESVERGGPVGPFTLSYLMAANHRLGRDAEALALARSYQEGWPGHRMDLLVGRLFADPAHAAELIEAMKGAGWSR